MLSHLQWASTNNQKESLKIITANHIVSRFKICLPELITTVLKVGA